MKEKNSHIIVFGGSKELDIVNFLLKSAIYSDKITSGSAEDILTSAALIQKCGLFLTNDTGPMHLAAAVGVPTVALFGSTNPVWTGPLGIKTAVIYKNPGCSPCFDRTCRKKQTQYGCLLNISEEDVFTCIEELRVF
jgi:ADP-heptose:LPS heptosyltransferase